MSDMGRLTTVRRWLCRVVHCGMRLKIGENDAA